MSDEGTAGTPMNAEVGMRSAERKSLTTKDARGEFWLTEIAKAVCSLILV